MANPRYSEAMARSLFSAGTGHPLRTNLYLGRLEMIEAELEQAKVLGQLDEQAPTNTLARQIQAQSWGVVMGWVMGIYTLQDIEREQLRSRAFILQPYVSNAVKAELQHFLGR